MSFSKKSAVVISDYWYAYRMFSKTRAAYRTVSKDRDLYNDVRLSDEQEKQIDDLYFQNFGEKISYNWHRLFTAASGSFSADYITEIIYNVLFEQTENYNAAFTKVMADKDFLDRIAKGIGIEYPEIIVSCSNGLYRKWDSTVVDFQKVISILNNSGDVFIKPSIDSNGGKGCYAACFRNGIDEITGDNVASILCGFGQNFIVQKLIKTHKDLSRLHSGSVNTFRINTYRWKDEIRCCPLVLRMGVGDKCMDNVSSGGIYIGVNENGGLCDLAHNGLRHGVIPFQAHPTSGVIFKGYKIEGVNNLINTAIRAHEAIPQLGSFNWDFTINDKGMPVLIEANCGWGGAYVMTQVSFGKGHFGEHTAEILQWLRVVKCLKHSERKYYLFGRGV